MHRRHDLLPALAVAVLVGVSGCGKEGSESTSAAPTEPVAEVAKAEPSPAVVTPAAPPEPVGVSEAPTAPVAPAVAVPESEPSPEVAAVMADVRKKLDEQRYMAAVLTLQTFITTKEISDDDKVRLYLLLDEFKAKVTAEANILGGGTKEPDTSSPAKTTAALPPEAAENRPDVPASSPPAARH